MGEVGIEFFLRAQRVARGPSEAEKIVIALRPRGVAAQVAG